MTALLAQGRVALLSNLGVPSLQKQFRYQAGPANSVKSGFFWGKSRAASNSTA
jgi:hypothetical protein